MTSVPEAVKGPVPLSLSFLKFLLKSLRNLGYRFHILYFEIKLITFTASSVFSVTVMLQGHSGCHSGCLSEGQLAGRRGRLGIEMEKGSREGKG